MHPALPTPVIPTPLEAIHPSLPPHQRADHLTMGGLGEEINRREALGAVAFGGQEVKITGHGLRVAADIDHPLGGHDSNADFFTRFKLVTHLAF